MDPLDTAVTAHLARAHRRGMFASLTRVQKLSLICLWIFAVGYGGMVESRGALLKSRHTDADVFFRAAWAVRSGADLYTITDPNGWHYIYPPLFAMLITPLADAPEGVSRTGMLPYTISVAIWYIISVGFFAVGVVMLARRLETALDTPSPRAAQARSVTLASTDGPLICDYDEPSLESAVAHRWWALRFWPVLLCIPATCRSVVRGQVGPLWLLLICGMIVAVLSRKPLRAGLWLAGAICLKVIPLYLLLYPVWRRNWRMIGGCLIGLFVGLVLIPLVVLGKSQFISANSYYLQQFILPAVSGRPIDHAVEHELMNPDVTDRQSIVSVLVNLHHTFTGQPRSFDTPLFAEVGHVLISGTMSLLTLLAAGWRREGPPLSEALFIGLLVLVMVPVAPVAHSHYFMMVLPLVAAICALFFESSDHALRLSSGWIVLLTAIPLSHVLTALPGLVSLREDGLLTGVSIVIWAAATTVLWRRTRDQGCNLVAHYAD